MANKPWLQNLCIFLMVLAFLAVAIAKAESVHKPAPIHVEKNTWGDCYRCPITGKWRFEKDGVQFIFWGWRSDEHGCGWEVREWVMADQAEVLPGDKFIHVRTGSVDRVIPMGSYLETKTGFDPEVFRRHITPMDKREGIW